MSMVSEIKRLAQAIGTDINNLMKNKVDKSFLGSAASKNVGIGDNDLVRAKDAYKVVFNRRDDYYNASSVGIDANDFELGTRHLVASDLPNMPPVPDFYLIETVLNYGSTTRLQKAWGYNNTSFFFRAKGSKGWTPWKETLLSDTNLTIPTISNGSNSYKRKWVKYSRSLTTGLNKISIPYGKAEVVSFNVKALVSVDGKTETVYANSFWDEWKLCVYDDRASKSLIITKEASVTNLDNASLLIYLELDEL